MSSKSRLDVVKTLLADEANRREKSQWEAILNDASLAPPLGDAGFEKQLYSLLIAEMEEGYRRKDVLMREKRKKAGRSATYIPLQMYMYVSPDIGRYIFAYFKWHGLSGGKHELGIEQKQLEDVAEAFNFKMDPMENKLQFMTTEERFASLDKASNAGYYWRVFGLIFGGLAITILAILNYSGRV